MYRVLIENIGGMFNHISLEVGKVCKMFSKKICECITLILKNSTGDDLIDYKIYGNSVQDGTPTPAAPIEVVSLGEGGKNLFDEDVVYSTLTKEDDVFSGMPYVISDVKYYIPENLVGKTLTFSAYLKTVTTTNLRVQHNGTYNGNLVNNSTDFERSTITFTPTSTTDYVCITYGSGQSTIYFKDVQLEEGSTATDYVPYKSVNVVTSSKNIFDKNNPNESNVWISSTGGGAGVTVGDYSIYVQIKPNTTYTVSLGVTIPRFRICSVPNLITSNVNTSAGTNRDGNTTATITTGANDIYLYVNLTSNEYLNNLQIEEGSTATPYEPYIAPTTTSIDLTGHEPLRKIGDVSDYIDYENRKIVRKIGKYILNGSESWTLNSNGALFAFVFNEPIGNFTSEVIAPNILSNYFLSRSFYSLYNRVFDYGISFGSNSANRFCIRNKDITTVADFKTWLSTNNVTVYYELATPTEEAITLPSIPTVEGTTILEIDNTPTASNMYCKYFADEEE